MYNRVILMGRLTADPELRQTQSGIAMCRFTVACDRYAKAGEQKEADFIQCTAWRNTAEMVSKWFSKGKPIHVEGRLQNNNYTDHQGVKRYSMDVQVDSVAFCGDGKSGNAQGTQAGSQGYTAQTYAQPTQAPSRGVQSPTQAQPVQQQIALGDMSDFEAIISDGEVPF